MKIENSEWGKKAVPKIKELKLSAFGNTSIKCFFNDNKYELLLLTEDRANDKNIITSLAKWRKENEHGFLGKFAVTFDRTLAWFQNNLIAQPDRLLFIIRVNQKYIGHLGFFRFDFLNRACEIDNIIRGEKGYPGIMGDAIISMMRWGKKVLCIEKYFLKVISGNDRAINLYIKLGFKEINRIPLISKEDAKDYVVAPDGWNGKTDKYYVVMEFIGKLED